MTRKFIIISVILVFIVSPFLAWTIVASQYADDSRSEVPNMKVTPATKDELLKAVTKTSKESHVGVENSNIKVLDIISYQHLDNWWYIVKVKYASYGKEDPIATPMLVVKYQDGQDSIQIVTNPGEPLPYYNISDSSGVPYDVIDKYNEAVNASQPEEEEEG